MFSSTFSRCVGLEKFFGVSGVCPQGWRSAFPAVEALKLLWACLADQRDERPPGVLVHGCEEHGDVGGAPSS